MILYNDTECLRGLILCPQINLVLSWECLLFSVFDRWLAESAPLSLKISKTLIRLLGTIVVVMYF